MGISPPPSGRGILFMGRTLCARLGVIFSALRRGGCQPPGPLHPLRSIGPAPYGRPPFSRPSVLLYSVGADVLIHPLSGFCGVGGGFAAAAASFFLSDQKETKESPGDVAFWKDLRLAPWSFRSLPYPLCPCGTSPPDRGSRPPAPLFYGGARGIRRQSRPARKPLERCLDFIAAALLSQ